jgi:KaiC/GvpD/RAD55 family RecA-like ATPase
MALNDYLTSLADAEVTPKSPTIDPRSTSKVLNESTDFYASIKSDPLIWSDVPGSVIGMIDELAACVLDNESNKTIITGHPKSGKSFIIEQFAYNITGYLKNSQLEELHFVRVSESTVIELADPKGLRAFCKQVCKDLGSPEENVCFVTEIFEIGMGIATLMPKARVILEMNRDIHFSFIQNTQRSSSKSWRDWNTVDVSKPAHHIERIAPILWCTIVQRLNKSNRNVSFVYDDIVDYVIQVCEAVEGLVDENELSVVPIGVWATGLRLYANKLSYTTDPDFMKDNGTLDEFLVMETSIEENTNLFLPYSENGNIGKTGVPETIFSVLSSEGFFSVGADSDTAKQQPVEPFPFDRINELEASLKSEVIGQDEAVETLVRGLRVASAGLNDPTKPVRSLLFLGPTGVGKTQLAISLANNVSKTPLPVVRIDMSEYQQSHEVAKLFGAPPGYVGYEGGGTLTSAVMKNPNSIILIDEVEKAHPKIWDSFLQVLDAGHMTDGRGVEVDFTQSVIIFTSNIGASMITRTTMGFANLSKFQDRKRSNVAIMQSELEKVFRPEMINRMDEIVYFDELAVDVLVRIVKREFEIINERFKARGFELDATTDVEQYILERADVSKYGARELQRIIHRNISSILAEYVLTNPTTKAVTLSVADNGIVANGD